MKFKNYDKVVNEDGLVTSIVNDYWVSKNRTEYSLVGYENKVVLYGNKVDGENIIEVGEIGGDSLVNVKPFKLFTINEDDNFILVNHLTVRFKKLDENLYSIKSILLTTGNIVDVGTYDLSHTASIEVLHFADVRFDSQGRTKVIACEVICKEGYSEINNMRAIFNYDVNSVRRELETLMKYGYISIPNLPLESGESKIEVYSHYMLYHTITVIKKHHPIFDCYYGRKFLQRILIGILNKNGITNDQIDTKVDSNIIDVSIPSNLFISSSLKESIDSYNVRLNRYQAPDESKLTSSVMLSNLSISPDRKEVIAKVIINDSELLDTVRNNKGYIKLTPLFLTSGEIANFDYELVNEV